MVTRAKPSNLSLESTCLKEASNRSFNLSESSFKSLSWSSVNSPLNSSSADWLPFKRFRTLPWFANRSSCNVFKWGEDESKITWSDLKLRFKCVNEKTYNINLAHFAVTFNSMICCWMVGMSWLIEVIFWSCFSDDSNHFNLSLMSLTHVATGTTLGFKLCNSWSSLKTV